MNVNFFGWVRDGVRRSVLLGIADAAEQLGSPDDKDDDSRLLLESLRGDARTLAAPRSRGGAKRKRLGRSLSDLQPKDNAAGADDAAKSE